MDLLNALDAATEEFGQRVALLQPGMLAQATPCPDWDVQYLVAHVVGGNRFGALILGGMPSSRAIELVMSAPQLGDDIMVAWTITSADQSEAFRSSTGLTRRVDHPLGAITGREFLEFRVFDITVHAWDLARAIGVDRRGRRACTGSGRCRDRNRCRCRPGMGFGIHALALAPLHASPQARLLDMAGRRP